MISLRAGSMLVTVDPTLGGSIVRAEHGGKALLRGNLDACDPVSYTHLTLPTSDLV